MLILHNLIQFGLPVEETANIYLVNLKLETSAVVWHSSITQQERKEIDHLQKVTIGIFLGSDNDNYPAALKITGLSTLDDRQKGLCKQFAKN